MNFYNKDRKYRKFFRTAHKQKLWMPAVVVLIMTVLIARVLLSGDSAEAVSGYDGVYQENTVVTDTPQKDNAVKNIISDIKIFSDKDSFFPDYTPAEGVITDGYGPRTDPEPSYHYALDIAGEFLSPIYASADGEIISCGSDDIYGLNVVIDHLYDGYKTKYAHMATYLVTEGMSVKKGDIIGFMGTTGYSTGVHLHFEITQNDKRLDPAAFIKIKDGRTVLN